MFMKMVTLLASLFLLALVSSNAMAGPGKRVPVETKLEPAAPPAPKPIVVVVQPLPAAPEPQPQLVCGWRTSTNATVVQTSGIQIQGMAVTTCRGNIWLNGSYTAPSTSVIPSASLTYQCGIVSATPTIQLTN